jgi:hypothetical protein
MAHMFQSPQRLISPCEDPCGGYALTGVPVEGI